MIDGPDVNNDQGVQETTRRLQQGKEEMERELQDLKAREKEMKRAEGRQPGMEPDESMAGEEHLPGLG